MMIFHFSFVLLLDKLKKGKLFSLDYEKTDLKLTIGNEKEIIVKAENL